MKPVKRTDSPKTTAITEHSLSAKYRSVHILILRNISMPAKRNEPITPVGETASDQAR
jgi:hypothetical protein